MRIVSGRIVPLGYGKYFRSDCIVGLEPIEEDRGPGRRTRVFVENLPEPIIASRSESAILRDVAEQPREVTNAREQRELLADILDTLDGLDPMIRSIVKDQSGWDLNRVAERIRDGLGRGEEE